MAIILYASKTQHTEDSVPITVKGFRSAPDKTIYIRAELKEDAWPGPAMQNAQVFKDEIALNAIPNDVVIIPKPQKRPTSEVEAIIGADVASMGAE